LRDCPPMVSKLPPAKTLPSACIAIEKTAPVAFGLKAVSSRAVRVQPGNVVARDRRSAVGRERCKVAAEKNLAVRLDDDDLNPGVRVRIETVQRGLPAHRNRAARQQHRNGKQ